jgi:hypothetical protein
LARVSNVCREKALVLVFVCQKSCVVAPVRSVVGVASVNDAFSDVEICTTAGEDHFSAALYAVEPAANEYAVPVNEENDVLVNEQF